MKPKGAMLPLLTVGCPLCNAVVGKGCTYPSGKERPAHNARWFVWKQRTKDSNVNTQQWCWGTCEIEFGGFELEARFKYLPKEEEDLGYPGESDDISAHEATVTLKLASIVNTLRPPIINKIDVTDMLEDAAGGSAEFWERAFERILDAGFQFTSNQYSPCDAPPEV
jgi:hypothetical protein